MEKSSWILFGVLLAIIGSQAVRGVYAGKRERKRMQALFRRIAECACPLCGRTYGDTVEKTSRISFPEEEELPNNLKAVERLCLWRITCPHCSGSALLAENNDIFQLLNLEPKKVEVQNLSRSYQVILMLLSLAIIGFSIYSLVQFFQR